MKNSSTKIGSNLSTIYDAHNTSSLPYILRHGSVYKKPGAIQYLNLSLLTCPCEAEDAIP